MWRRRERDLEAWSQRMRAHGRVEFGTRRWLVVLLAGFALLLGVGGVAGLSVGSADMSGTVAFGLLAIFGFGMLALMVKVAARAGPALVVDSRGIHLPPAELELPWRAVRSVGVIRVRLVPILYVQLDRAFQEGMVRDSPAVWRLAHALDDRVTLPFPLAADVDHLADWLNREVVRRA